MAEKREGLYARSAAADTAAMAWTKDPLELGALYFNRGQAFADQEHCAGAVADYTRSGLLCRQATDSVETPHVPGHPRDTYGQRASAYYQLKQYAGTVYLSATSTGVMQLAGHDATPYSRSTLPLIRASILTFRKL